MAPHARVRERELYPSLNSQSTVAVKRILALYWGNQEIIQLLSYVGDIVQSIVIHPQINPLNLAFKWRLFFQKLRQKIYLSRPKMVLSFHIGYTIRLEDSAQNGDSFEKCFYSLFSEEVDVFLPCFNTFISEEG